MDRKRKGGEVETFSSDTPGYVTLDVSLYENAMRPKPTGTLSVRAVLARIAEPTPADRTTINKIRKHVREHGRRTSDATLSRLKKDLTAVTWSGTFVRRREGGLKVSTGVVCLDLDDVGEEQAAALRTEMDDDPRILAAFLSPTGLGLKVLMVASVGPEGGGHKAAWEMMARYVESRYKVAVDASGSDLSRLCFLSWDPEVRVKTDIEVWRVDPNGETGAREVEGEEGDVDTSALLDRGDARVDGMGIDEVAELMGHLDPDRDRPSWVKVGLALKAQFIGTKDEDAALEVWQAWSRGDYHGGVAPENWEGDRDVEREWGRLKGPEGRRRPVTLGSLLSEAEAVGYARPSEVEGGAGESPETEGKALAARLRKEVEAATDEWELEDLLDELRLTPGIKRWRGDLVDRIAERLKGEFDRAGEKRELKRRAAFDLEEFYKERGAPPWVEGWAFDQVNNCWVRVRGSGAGGLSNQAFDMTMRQHLPDKEGSVSTIATALSWVPVVDGSAYRPGEDAVFEYEGRTLANSFDPNSVPEPKDPLEWTKGEARGVWEIERYLDEMIGPEDAAVYLDFFAWHLQRPGERLPWAIHVYGPLQGTGKDTMAAVMSVAFGPANAYTTTPSAVSSSFNSWANGGWLCVCNEMVLDQSKRWAVANSMKTLITDQKIEITKKGKDPVNARNVTAYLFHSNPPPRYIEEGDRRLFVSRTKMPKNAPRRCARIRAWAEANAEVVAGWLMARDTAGVPARAPMTDVKQELIDESRSSSEVALEDLLGDALIVSPKDLVDGLGGKDRWPVQRVVRALSDLGWSRIGADVDLRNSSDSKVKGLGRATLYAKKGAPNRSGSWAEYLAAHWGSVWRPDLDG